jgi:hypothetical protein
MNRRKRSIGAISWAITDDKKKKKVQIVVSIVDGMQTYSKDISPEDIVKYRVIGTRDIQPGNIRVFSK